MKIDGVPLLHLSCKNSTYIKALIARGANLNILDKDNQNALEFYLKKEIGSFKFALIGMFRPDKCYEYAEKVAENLLSVGVLPLGSTVNLAVKARQENLLNILINYGARPTSDNLKTAIENLDENSLFKLVDFFTVEEIKACCKNFKVQYTDKKSTKVVELQEQQYQMIKDIQVLKFIESYIEPILEKKCQMNVFIVLR